MRDTMSRVKTLVAMSLCLCLSPLSCVPDPVPPPPPKNLEERREALAELKKQLEFMVDAKPEKLVALLDHPDLRVRARAARRLGEWGGDAKSSVPNLVQKLDDESQEVRIEATIALGNIGDEKALFPLLKTMVDSERKVRFWGWKSIRKFGDRAYPVIMENLKSDSKYAKQFYKDEAGNKKDFQAEVRFRIVTLGDKIIEYLIKGIRDDDNTIRTNAAKSLSGFGKAAKDALPALADALEATLKTSPDETFAVSAIRAMKDIGDLDPVVIPTLTKAALAENKEIAKEAKTALKKLR